VRNLRNNIRRETVLVRCDPIPESSRLFRRKLNLCYRLDALETVFPWNNQPQGTPCCLGNVSSFIASAIVRPSVSDQRTIGKGPGRDPFSSSHESTGFVKLRRLGDVSVLREGDETKTDGLLR
jgi:hypothetical protein